MLKRRKLKSIGHDIYRYSFFVLLALVISILGYNYICTDINVKYYEEYSKVYNLNVFYLNIENIYSQIFKDEIDISLVQKKIEEADDSFSQLLTKTNKETSIWKNVSKIFENIKKTILPINKNYCENDKINFKRDAEELLLKRDSSYRQVEKEIREKKEVLIQSQKLSFIFLFVIFFLFMIWLIGFSYLLIQKMIVPIHIIIEKLHEVKSGNYNGINIDVKNKEIDELCDAVENMAIGVEQNIKNEREKVRLENKLIEQEYENLKKDEILLYSELNRLQNQINPHFLFNTLNMLMRIAETEGAEKTADLMERTSRFLRYGLDYASNVSTIQKEITAIKDYIFIQEKRLGNRIKFSVKIEEGIDFEIPGLILQPLVENAVMYGVNDCINNGKINISVREIKNVFVIIVSDNGKGMNGKDLERLIIQIEEQKDSHRIGLHNVTKRLSMFFGDAVKVSFNSKEGCGFEIIITISKDGRGTLC
ncbi:MAG: histidine kinase [Bacilli bacterium]